MASASRSRIPEFVALARTIRRYRDLVWNALDHNMSNARSEAAQNTHLRALTKRAYGYHSPDALIGMAMLTQGWEQLCRTATDDTVLIPNVRLTSALKDHELDVVVIMPGVGVVVVEVKGGSVSVDAQGQWWTGGGTRRSRIRPVDQCRDGKYALRDVRRGRSAVEERGTAGCGGDTRSWCRTPTWRMTSRRPTVLAG